MRGKNSKSENIRENRSLIIKKTVVVYLIMLILFGGNKISAQTEGNTPTPTQPTAQITSNPDVILTQNWAMPTLLNPAATGDIDYIRVRGGARLDYLGSKDSPKNFLLTGDSPFKLSGKRIGTGIIINSQSYDLFRNILVGAQGSYKFKIKNSTLSIGLQLGYYHSKFKGSEMRLNTSTGPGTGEEEGEENPDSNEENDEDYNEFPTQDVAGGAFDVGLALRYQHPKFHLGLSALHLTNSRAKLKKDGESSTDLQYIESKLPMTLYFDAGGNIAINNSLFTLQPSVMVGTDFKDFTGVAEMRATYNSRYTFGVDYRWNRAAGVFAGVAFKDFYLGYSWEYDYSAQPHGSTGNHEIVLGYQFKLDMGGKNTFSHRSIRIM